MAELRNLTPEELEKQNKLLRERDEILQRIEERNKRIAVAGGDEIKRLEKRNQKDKEHLDNLAKELEGIQDIKDEVDEYADFWEEAAKKQQSYNDLQEEYGTSFAKLTPSIKNLLVSQQKGGGAFAAITAKILEIKKQEINASGEDLIRLQERRATLEKVRQTQLDAAETAGIERDNLFGVSDAVARRLEFQASITGLSEEDKKLAMQIYERNEALTQQAERYKEISAQTTGLYNALPEGLQTIASGISNLVKATAKGLGPIVVLAGILALAMSEFTEIAEAQKKFRQETGLTADQTRDIDKQVKNIRHEFAGLGVEAEDVYDSIAALKKEFGDSLNFSEGIVSSVAVMNKNFGIAQSDAAAVNMMFQSMAGLSATTAQNVSMQLVDLAKMSGVAPSQVFKDIADSAEESYKYFRGDINALYRAAIEARRLGTNIKSVLNTTEKLLDFEEGIEKELVAATFVGGQFNLSQARALAYAGRHVDAQKEILRQVQRTGDFRKMDVFTQRALADAANMSVEEITKQLTMQEKLVGLSEEQKKLFADAIDKGLDITDMTDSQLKDKTKELEKQQQIADAVTKMENAFKGITAALATGFVPLMEGLAPVITVIGSVFGFILNVLNKIPGLLPAIIAGLTTMYILSKKAAIMKVKEAIASIFAGNAKWGAIGLIAASAGVVGLMAAISSNTAKVGDMASMSGGKTIVSTKEGGLFELSENDDFAAAPGLMNRLAGKPAGNLSKSESVQRVANNTTKFIKELTSEMKGLRADLNSGKIVTNTYLDGQKVTTGIAVANEQSTRNNFSYGTRM